MRESKPKMPASEQQQGSSLFADDLSHVFFTGGAFQQRLDLLKQAIRFGNQTLFLIAPSGSGKTTTLSKLIESDSTDWVICEFRGHASVNQETVRQEISTAFSLAIDQAGPLNMDIDQVLDKIRASARMAVLIVDNADQLSAPALQPLAEWTERHSQPEGGLRIIFSSDNDHVVTTWKSLIRGRNAPLVEVLDLPSLSITECDAYLRLRWITSGTDAPFPFSTQDVANLQRMSGGRPAALNYFAGDQISDHRPTASGNSGRPYRFTRTGFGLGGLVLTALLAGLLLLRAPTSPQERPAVQPLALPSMQPAVPDRTGEPAASSAPDLPSVPIDQKQAIPERIVEAPAPTREPPAPARPPVVAPLGQSLFAGFRPDEYLLQILGSSNRAAVESYVSRNRLGTGATIIETSREQKPWFVLFYGRYPSREAAESSISTLPKELRQIPPWPRQVSELRNQLAM